MIQILTNSATISPTELGQLKTITLYLEKITMYQLKTIILTVFLFALATISYAQTENNHDNQKDLKYLIELLNIEEQCEEIFNGAKTQLHQLSNELMTQTPEMNELPESAKQQINQAFKDYMTKSLESFRTEKMLQEYIALLSNKLTNDEVKEVIEFYESPIGKKFVNANTSVSQEWANKLFADFNKSLIIEIQALDRNINTIMAQHKKQAEESK